jgi:hypothetical protein
MEQLRPAQHNTQVYVECVSTPEGTSPALDLYIAHPSASTAIESYRQSEL